jgi:hypothetical protein
MSSLTQALAFSILLAKLKAEEVRERTLIHSFL